MKAALARRVILLLTLAALASPAAADDGAKVVGTWDMAAATPDGEVTALLTVAEAEGACGRRSTATRWKAPGRGAATAAR